MDGPDESGPFLFKAEDDGAFWGEIKKEHRSRCLPSVAISAPAGPVKISGASLLRKRWELGGRGRVEQRGVEDIRVRWTWGGLRSLLWLGFGVEGVGVEGHAFEELSGLAGGGDVGEVQGVAQAEELVECGEVVLGGVAVEGDVEEERGESVGLEGIEAAKGFEPVRDGAAVVEQG